MNPDLILIEAFLAYVTFIALLFFFQRARYRHRKRKKKKNLGFYPSAAGLSVGLLPLQIIAQPDAQHTLEEQLKEVAEDDEEGDPDDPALQLSRQLKRIRYGKPVGDLRIPLRNGLSTPASPDPQINQPLLRGADTPSDKLS